MFISNAAQLSLFAFVFYSASVTALKGAWFSEADFAELIELNLEDVLKIKVDSSSSFDETQLTSSSSLSVITSQQWNARGDRTFPDVISHATNTMVYPTLWGGHAFQVRGYGASLSARGSATILDGVPLNTLLLGTTAYYSNSPQLGVLDKVEVIRGPGSALYGSDAFHSVVSYSTFESKEKLFNASLESGERGFYKSHVKFAQPLDNGTYFNVAIGTNGQGKQKIENKYRDPLTNQELSGNFDSELKNYSVVAKIFNQHSDSLHYKIRLYQNDQVHSNHPGFGELQNKENIKLGSLDFTSLDMRTSVLSLRLESSMSENYRYGLDCYFWTLKGLQYSNITNSADDPAVDTFIRYLEERKYGYHVNVFKKYNTINTNFALKIGVDNSSIKSNDIETVDLVTSAVISPRASADILYDEQIVYKSTLETQTQFSDNILLTLGLGWVNYPTFGSHTSPRLSLVLNPTENSAFKLIYGNAFRAPIVTEVTGSATIIGNPDLKPEILDSLEFVYMYLNRDWKVETSIYASEWSDGISIASVDSTDTESRTRKYLSSAKSESKGIEFGFEYSPNIWSYAQSISYIQSKNLGANEDYSAYPTWILNSDFAYEYSGDLTFNVNLKIYDDYYLGDKISARDPSSINKGGLFSRIDLRIHKRISDTSETWFDVKNIFDHKNVHPSVWNAENGVPDINRQIAVGIKYIFGH